MPSQNIIEEYIDRLIAQAGFAGLPADFQEEQKANIRAQIQQRLGLAVAKRLQAEDLAEFSNLLKNQTAGPDELFNFFQARVDNFEAVIKEVFAKFTEEFFRTFKLEA